ncbi:glycoside hydrolase family 97 protein [Bacteroides faecium]|uniref:Glycoside hydrolase family 97 protein n=1 Tax=Bacteroides faecium TaxID=2715212 RepID=A0A6H0KH09_9BACE|nr:glycoside hydrolase family 97 protein [Bacteroides faecium]QIU92672.1 glycoside hydrolase family 97 protein [Bacteroides faecium]
MKNKRYAIVILFFICTGVFAHKKYEIVSPDGKLKVNVTIDKTINYSVVHETDTMLYSSAISMETDNYIFGKTSGVKRTVRNSVDQMIVSPFYKRDKIHDYYNELLIQFKEQFNLVFRVYNEGMAYRFVSTGTKPFIVKNEEANFNLGKNRKAYIPYVRKSGSFEEQYFNTFENTYEYKPVNEWKSGQLAFLPLLVEADKGKKICITEADLESYPGMYLLNSKGNSVLQSMFAPYPKRTAQGSHDKSTTVGGHNKVVLEREPFIAKCKGGQAFPWRVVIVSEEDKELVDNDMVYKLAEPSRLDDTSWIEPGQVAWEWWNDWNISGVDFKSGVNNETYKYYIDFAAKNKIKYVILDDGWYDRMEGSVFAVAPDINLEELIHYALQRDVGLILWMGYFVFDKDLEKAIKHYAGMGIKGFKLDAVGRDDQLTNEFYYKSARLAAEHKLIIDFHGGAKPAGINRTYPNVLNFEGVHGLEQLKNKNYDCDMVTYDVTFPFIRMVAGAVDYTQGAMKNGTKADYRSVWSEPMSQGTRCRQLAEYVVFESPLNMLCDSPTNYMKEQECTSFITSIPTIWDDTVVMDGEIGEYISLARRRGDSWYVGALTNWDTRSLELDLSFLGEGAFKAEVFRDGINANRMASDYVKEVVDISPDKRMKICMAPGGGYVMRITKK